MTWLEGIWNDAFHVLRTLRRQPTFAVVAVLTLALEKIPFAVDPSPGNFLDWRKQTHSFDRMAAWRKRIGIR